jgi:hypothetical protein
MNPTLGAVVLGCALAAADEGLGSYESARDTAVAGFPASRDRTTGPSLMAELKKYIS